MNTENRANRKAPKLKAVENINPESFTMRLSAIVSMRQTPNGMVATLNDNITALMQNTGEKTSQKAKYQLAKIGKALKAEVTGFQEAYFDLVKEMGEEQMVDSPSEKEDVDGKQVPKKVPSGQYSIPTAIYQAFSEKVDELLAVEVCIPLRPIKIDDFGPEGLSKASADNLMACTDFIVD